MQRVAADRPGESSLLVHMCPTKSGPCDVEAYPPKDSVNLILTPTNPPLHIVQGFRQLISQGIMVHIDITRRRPLYTVHLYRYPALQHLDARSWSHGFDSCCRGVHWRNRIAGGGVMNLYEDYEDL